MQEIHGTLNNTLFYSILLKAQIYAQFIKYQLIASRNNTQNHITHLLCMYSIQYKCYVDTYTKVNFVLNLFNKILYSKCNRMEGVLRCTLCPYAAYTTAILEHKNHVVSMSIISNIGTYLPILTYVHTDIYKYDTCRFFKYGCGNAETR